VRLNPFDPVALNNLAVNYAATGDYQNAVALLERAQRLAPNRPDIVNNLANLKAWMAQDSQFATGARTATPQALNFPRAEDTPPELPPLWAGPQPTYPVANQVQPASAARAGMAPNYGNAAAPNYAPVPQGYAQPAYGQGQAAPQITYQQPNAQAQQPAPMPAARAYSRAPGVSNTDYASRVSRQTVITERAPSSTVKKRKRQQPLDCPVP
jgi:tetratricopeptide (TPR) repeat protein